MQSDFKKAAQRLSLFAAQATVVTLVLDNVTVTETNTAPGGEPQVTRQEYVPAKLLPEFLDYLKEKSVGHAVISQTDTTLVFAAARDAGVADVKIREHVKSFFSEGRQVALASESYLQHFDSDHKVKNALLAPFSKTRRDVNRLVKTF